MVSIAKSLLARKSTQFACSVHFYTTLRRWCIFLLVISTYSQYIGSAPDKGHPQKTAEQVRTMKNLWSRIADSLILLLESSIQDQAIYQ